MKAEFIGTEQGQVVPRGVVTFSLRDGVPAARRRGAGREDNLRVGLFETRTARQLCLIRNISRSGARVRVYRRYRIGTRAVIDLKTGHRLEGTVVWAQMGHVGVEFEEMIDVDALFSTESLQAKGHRARLPRVECQAPVTVRSGDSLLKGQVVDISQGGIKVESEQPIATGRAVVLLPGLYPISSQVRWSEGSHAGIAFDELIPFRRLVERTRQWASEDPEAPPSNVTAFL